MILISSDIEGRSLVNPNIQDGRRATTYDATVGTIISNGKIIGKDTFRLPKRGIAWVVSREEFSLPNNTTGLATLRTTWTHNGVLALNVGILDPNFTGHLATAVVNYGDGAFTVRKGDRFFRVLFFEHAPTPGTARTDALSFYIDEVKEKSKATSDTFLNLHHLTREVVSEIWGLPFWVRTTIYLAILGVVAALFATFAPIALDVWGKTNEDYASIKELKQEFKELKDSVTPDNSAKVRRATTSTSASEPQGSHQAGAAERDTGRR